MKLRFLCYSEFKEQDSEFAHIQLSNFTFIKTLGVGGFGRVELVKVILFSLNSLVFLPDL